MTKPEIIAKLTELGVAHDPTAKKADLEALLPAPSVAPPVATPEEAQAVAKGIIDVSWKSIANSYVFVKEPQTAKSLSTANKFAAEPKVRITVFPTADEPDQRLMFVGINGFFVWVVVGLEVEVPQSIAEHITKSRTLNSRIERNIVITNPVTGERVNVNLDHAPNETKRRLGLL